MNETAGMLEARLGLIERIRKVEHALAHAEQARVASALMRGRSHDLGNAVQIIKLSALELSRRLSELDANADLEELIADMNVAADQSAKILAAMIDATRPIERLQLGAVVTHPVRAAIDLARTAILAPIDLRMEVDDTVHTYCTAEELEVIVLAAALDASAATRITFVLRERLIQGKRWVELLRFDDRQVHEGDYAEMFESCSLLRVVAGCAKEAAGEVSLSPGRGGLELAVELPVAGLR
ncbi:MAG TPA: hypothetical protein VLB44_16340 [Kofleriaceae bacterium]|nr:hypothetical protein [Kofleriaceae bacterium]